MSNQDNINSFLDSMDDFNSIPAAEATSPQSVPFTPAAVWPGEEPAQQTAAAAQARTEPTLAAPPTAQPAAPQEAIPAPATAVQIPQTQQVAPIIQQQQPVMQPAAPDPAPVQQTMLDPFDAAMQNLEVQGEKRMLEALAAKPAIFSYAKVKENIEDRDSTFEDLRQRYEADFPELSDSKTITWTVNYGKTAKTVNNPGSDKVYDIKAEIESSQPFKDALKKLKQTRRKIPNVSLSFSKWRRQRAKHSPALRSFALQKRKPHRQISLLYFCRRKTAECMNGAETK